MNRENIFSTLAHLGSAPPGTEASRAAGSCCCLFSFLYRPLSSPSSLGSLEVSSSAETPTLLTNSKAAVLRLNGRHNEPMVYIITERKVVSVITGQRQKGAVEHNEGNLFLLKKRVCVCVTSVCRPVPEDLQWTLIVIQNHLLARLVILLHTDRHTLVILSIQI